MGTCIERAFAYNNGFGCFCAVYKISADKFIKSYFTDVRAIIKESNNTKKYEEYLQKNSDKIGYSYLFTVAAIVDLNYSDFINNKNDDHKVEIGNLKYSQDDKETIEKLEAMTKIYEAFNGGVILLLQDCSKTEFNKQLDQIADKLTDYSRSISLFELTTRIVPETALGNGTNIFYGDALGSIALSLNWILVLLILSTVLNLMYIIASIIRLANIDAATTRYYRRCLGKDGKKVNSKNAVKFQGSYSAPLYILAYLAMLIISFVAVSAKTFAKNICSCMPFLALTLSPFTYVIVGLEAIICLMSLGVNAFKRNIRNNL